MTDKIFDWLNDRYKIDGFLHFTKKKTVPVHKGSIWYYFGGISLFLFGIQLLTGILLLLYYRVGPDASFESVKYILTQVKFGWLLRAVHAWSANLMVLAVIIHLVSVYFQRSYRAPRELSWVTGTFLFFLSMAFGFSGYLLPWNELAFFATKVGTDSTGSVPIIGDFLLTLMRGGSDVTGITLSRFFGLHISILPPVFTIILAFHLMFVQTQGMSEPIHLENSTEPKKTMPFFPNFALRDLVVWFVVFDILLLLSIFFPWELGTKADPFTPAPAGIKPEWYFLAIFQSLKILPAHFAGIEGELIGIVVISIVALVTIFMPFLDRAASKGIKNRVWDALGIFGLAYFAIFTILGFILD